ncbi:hypothetical protein ACH0BF_02105 [Pseudobacillus sp. 179-B 2D1 NHS]|uniref:hypothetical protein n=1 Tax=Pseudobacillus sp. 179-B 2D1 NHS TaxID=3374292 RepID=UPI0038797FC2
MMNEVWKLDKNYYCLYVESKDVMKRIKRYYTDFVLMAEYYDHNGKLQARQYKVEKKRKRVAVRLKNIG